MSIFTQSDILAELRGERLLITAGTYFPGVTLSDDYLWAKVLAAEADASRRIRTLLEPTTIFAGAPTDAEIIALAGAPYRIEPAYDYIPQMFTDAWGALITRQQPVISIESMTFVYPMPNLQTWVVPHDWIRFDSKSGMVQIVPTGIAMATSLSLFLMQIVGGGRDIPQMLTVRYRAGIVDAANTYPDLVDTIKRGVVLRIIRDAFVPQSGSISADGLSRTFSADVDKYQDAYDAALNMIKDEIHGPMFVVC